MDHASHGQLNWAAIGARRRVYTTLATIAILLVACGGSTAPGDGGTSPTPADSAQSPAQAAGEGGTLAAIEERGRVVVGLEAQLQPFQFVEDGEIVGGNVDLANLIFKEGLGVDVEFRDITFSGLLTSLETGQVDVIMSGLVATEERLAAFDYTIPHWSQVNQVLVREDSTIAELDDLAGKSIGVQVATQQEDELKLLNEDFRARGLPEVNIVAHERVPLSFQDLLIGRLDAVIDADQVLRAAIEAEPGKVRIAFDIWDPIFQHAQVRKGDTELLNFMDQQLEELKSNGTLADLHEKWFGRNTVDDLPASVDEVMQLQSDD